MIRYIIIRIGQGIIALLIATVLVFILARISGNPLSIMLPDTAPQEQVDNMRAYLGLDKPLYVQYAVFIAHVAIGDLGQSIFYKRSVAGLFIERLPATMMLGLTAMFISVLIAVPVGVLAASKREKWQDGLTKVFAIFGQSAPAFWLGIMLILVFAVNLNWLPAGGYGSFSNLILPALTVATFPVAGFMRLTRSSMLDNLGTDFVRLARIKGLTERQVIWKHALRNALIPVVTYAGVVFVNALTGSVIVETVFAWPGIGQLAFQALKLRDFPLIQGILIYSVGLFVLINLLIDILYVYIDPRIRFTRS
jgi:peptide/nickel transport system permease protein